MEAQMGHPVPALLVSFQFQYTVLISCVFSVGNFLRFLCLLWMVLGLPSLPSLPTFFPILIFLIQFPQFFELELLYQTGYRNS
jgi:hypothetical protein